MIPFVQYSLGGPFSLFMTCAHAMPTLHISFPLLCLLFFLLCMPFHVAYSYNEILASLRIGSYGTALSYVRCLDPASLSTLNSVLTRAASTSLHSMYSMLSYFEPEPTDCGGNSFRSHTWSKIRAMVFLELSTLDRLISNCLLCPSISCTSASFLSTAPKGCFLFHSITPVSHSPPPSVPPAISSSLGDSHVFVCR